MKRTFESFKMPSWSEERKQDIAKQMLSDNATYEDIAKRHHISLDVLVTSIRIIGNQILRETQAPPDLEIEPEVAFLLRYGNTHDLDAVERAHDALQASKNNKKQNAKPRKKSKS